ncbi:hypothetical protein [Synechococcus sp. PCC 7336]|uniref:hypothetical protein n=1 Tax=Synechococcus sp. PCC 7336 TaxID=195250 RepID=UPI00034BA37E|nr:hypothetical protein [Synechococcus sp. PCC 7336]
MMTQTVLPPESSVAAIAEIANYALRFMDTDRSSLLSRLSEEQTELGQLLSRISPDIDPAKIRNAAAEIVSYCIVISEMANYAWLKHDELVTAQVEVVVQQLLA